MRRDYFGTSHLARSAVGYKQTSSRLKLRSALPRVVKKLRRALGASLVSSESTAAGHVVPGSSDLLRPIENGANS